MRHRKTGVKLGRTGSHRNAMFRNMVTSLLKHGKIKTTDTKAKELRRWADHIITLAKRGDLHARRQALAIVREKNVVHKLFEDAGQRFGARNGGYTRLTKIGVRAGDAAPMTLVELLSGDEGISKKKKKKQQPAAEPAPEAVATPEPEAAEVAAEEAPAEETDEAADTAAAADEDAPAPEAEATEAAEEAPQAEAAEEAPEEPVAEAAEAVEDAAPEEPAAEDAGEAKDEEEPKE